MYCTRVLQLYVLCKCLDLSVCVCVCVLAGQHWIRLEIQPNILLEQLAIQVSPLDASYMPVSVAVYGGQTIGGLKELKTCSIPSSAREFVLVSGLTEVEDMHCACVAMTVILVPRW